MRLTKKNHPQIDFIITITGVFSILLLLIGCNPNLPRDVSRVIKKAGANGPNLEKVIDHYKQTGEEQKLLAAYYLIGNMEDKYGISYPNNAAFFQLLTRVDSLRISHASSDVIDKFIDNVWAQDLADNHNRMPRQQLLDIDVITTDYLIENIELAFKVWKEKPWCQHLTFDEFCEWILPYRISDEPLQNWRRYMYDQLNWLEDSLENHEDLKEACTKINSFLARDFQFSHKLGFVPKLGGIDAWNNKQGLCEHRYHLVTMAMRSIGIPVCIDFTPHYPNDAGGHSWTTLLDQDHKIKTFNGGEKVMVIFNDPICPIGIDDQVLVTTVFRNYYAANKNTHVFETDDKNIPDLFKNKYIKNVTVEYTGVKKVDLTFDIEKIGRGVKHVFLYTFSVGQGMVPVATTEVKNKKAIFKNIGRGGIYLPGYEKDGRIMILAQPVDLPKENQEVIPIEPDLNAMQSVKLFRKAKVKYTMIEFMKHMQGSKIQGSNTIDFKNAETIFTIDTLIDSYAEFPLNQSAPYRYYRYLSTDSGNIRLSELDFIGITPSGKFESLNGKIFGLNANPQSDDNALFENAFDNDIATNFNAPAGSWVAQDAGLPIKLNSFKILPRNNLNIVVPGDHYELLYFKNGWHSVGQKTADNYFVEFENVPTKAILLLRNLTRGRDERIFFYEHGRQNWK